MRSRIAKVRFYIASFSISLCLVGNSTATVGLSYMRDLTDHFGSFSSLAGISVQEKIMRKLFYAGNLGYSVGLNEEFDFKRGDNYSTSHGLGYKVTDKFNMTLSFGVNYNTNRDANKFHETVILSASYVLWE